jgi:hypothetical protein
MNSVIFVFSSSGEGNVGGGGFCSVVVAAVYDRRSCAPVQNTAAPENLPSEAAV